MKITVSQLRRIIREEVEKNLTESNIPLKDGGVVNRDSGEWLEIDNLPPQYLDHVEIEMGYTTLPNEQFEELRGETKETMESPLSTQQNEVKHQFHSKHTVVR